MSHDELTINSLDLMESEERRELLNAYLDGELSADPALIVSQWLDSNPGALREVEHLRHIWDLLESYEDEPVPEAFASGVLDAVGIQRPAVTGEGGRVLSMAWYRRPLATAAAVLIAIGATAFVMSSRDSDNTPGAGYSDTSIDEGLSARSGVPELEALGLEDLETLEYLHVIADADDETFEDLVAGSGLGGVVHSIFRPLPACLAAVLVLVLGVTTALPASAGGEEADTTPAVERLKPDELEFLKKKFPEWDKVDARRKEHIARNVIRLRNMSPEEREKLQGRVDRLRKGRKGHGKGRHSGSQMFRVADEIGARLIDRLPASVREELAKLDVRPSMARMTVFRMLKGKAAAGVSGDLGNGEPGGGELKETDLARLPERMRKRVQEMIATAQGDPKKLAAVRARVHRMLAWGRMATLQKRLKAESGGKEVPATALAEGLMQEWKPAVEELVAEISADPKPLLAAVQRTERDYMSKTDYTKSIWALERLALSKWRRDPDAQAAANRVVRRLLIDELHADRQAVDALPGYDAPRERRAALSKLIPGTRGGERSAGKERSRSGRRGGKGARRKAGAGSRTGQGRQGPKSRDPK